MADLLIKGMTMPASCLKCPAQSWCSLHLTEAEKVHDLLKANREDLVKPFIEDYIHGRLYGCPLVEVEETKRVNIKGEWETIWQVC